MVPAECLHVHTFACALSWGMGLFWRIQNERSCWAWVSAFRCRAQATLLVTLWLLLLAEYSVLPWHECPYECVLSQREAHCVLAPAVACAHCGGRPEHILSCPALRPGPGGYVECMSLCMAPITAACMRRRAHSRRASETRNVYFTPFSP